MEHIIMQWLHKQDAIMVYQDGGGQQDRRTAGQSYYENRCIQADGTYYYATIMVKIQMVT